MNERFLRLVSDSRRRPLLFAVGAVVGFIVIVGSQLHPPDPEARLPAPQRLAALIKRTQEENEQRRVELQALQDQIKGLQDSKQSQQVGSAEEMNKLSAAGLSAGLVAMNGLGFKVELNDSSLSSSPTGNVNDLVIHSQDVQAVVNGLWASGAEAIAVNGERLVSTSAVLCVGNTLLINGSVYSPPYSIAAIGADRNTFMQDAMVEKLKDDAERFSLKFSVGREENLTIPGYSGVTTPQYAKVADS